MDVVTSTENSVTMTKTTLRALFFLISIMFVYANIMCGSYHLEARE